VSASAETSGDRGGAPLGTDDGGGLRPRDWLLIIGIMLATILELIDTSIVNVALPDMMANLGATVDEISLVITCYIIANVTVIPMTSWLASRFGRRRYLVGSILLFTAASVLCGLSSSLGELVAFRILQGIGGGALLSSSQALMVEIFPVQRQGMGQAIFGMGATLGPSLGPTLGGWLTDQWSWPWIFFVNLPFGIVAAWLCWHYLPRARHLKRPVGVDWLGIVLLIVGIGSLQYTIERGNHYDWFDSARIRATAVIAVFTIVGFVIHELRTEHPVIDLRILRFKQLTIGCTYGTVLGVGLYGSIFLFPLFTQGLLGWNSWHSGLAVLPSTLTTALLMPIAGRNVMRTGPALMCGFGLAIFVPSLYGMSHWTLQSGWWDLFWPQVGRGVALSFMFVPMSLVTLRSLPPEHVLQGAALYNLCRQTGGSLGIAVLATMLQHRTDIHHAYLAEHVSPLSPVAWQRLESITAGLQARGLDPAAALDAARRMLDGIVTAQASVLAFADAYKVVMVLVAVMLPFVWLMRRPPIPVTVVEPRAAAEAD